MRVLVIEDERRLAENIANSLRERCGFAIDVATDGEDGYFMASSNPYDAVVLDLMLPLISGTEILRRFRDDGLKVPVLILTARYEKSSIVTLLNSGADDYLAKPFDLDELAARLQALIRRNHGCAHVKRVVGDIELDTTAGTVRRAGVQISVTPMEYRVFEYLMYRPDALVSKTELLEHLYDYNWEKFGNVIEVYVAGLRRKLDTDPLNRRIHTLRGRGYILRSKPEGA
jgi:DNA-binding response OmpR family regulator